MATKKKNTAAPKKKKATRAATSFPIVGIGASAGGLEAFQQLLTVLPPDTGMAFVLVQHLDPSHESFLPDVLRRSTRMPVVPIEDDIALKPDRIYVIPPGCDLDLRDGVFALLPRGPDAGRLPIDFFFRALAGDATTRAIGVVLSGLGHDGTEGLRAIEAADGVTIVQDPATAKFSGMPQNAAASGVANYVLAVPQIAEELVRLSRHPYVLEDTDAVMKSVVDDDEESLRAIFGLLHGSSGVDFSEYKDTTIRRRMARRLALRDATSLAEYLAILEIDPSEVRALSADVLVHVTSFFRDPGLFDVLKARAFPEIVKNKTHRHPVRMWVAGCATGEEVYSLAMAFLEYASEAHVSVPLQIFGSDVSERAIEQARAGVYRESVISDVSVDRLQRFFVKIDGGHRISKAVRDLCVFVRHDLARDPPFSRVDLASCRNVLIYFNAPLQKRVMTTFHYALNQPGFLVLGHSESVGSHPQLFNMIDREHKIFARSGAATALRFPPLVEPRFLRRAIVDPVDLPRPVDLSRHVDNLLLGRYAPAGVIVNDANEILQFRGRTGLYLESPPGSPQRNVLKMARDGLLADLRQALGKAKKDMTTVRRENVRVRSPGDVVTSCNVVVEPMAGVPGSSERLFVVLFEERGPPEIEAKKKNRKGTKAAKDSGPDHVRATRLERELSTAKEYLQSLIEEHQRAADEIATSNEELVSSNEEMQSLNEELETAKEELQSSNEELTTVNDELRSRHEELAQMNNDLTNILSSVEIPLVILDNARRIRRFTPKARAIMNLVPSDVGRPIEDIKSNLKMEDLEKVIAEVIDTMTTKELEVQDRDQHWHRIQIRPYKTAQNRIEGAILSLIDIHALKAALEAAEDASKAKDLFLATVSHELRTPLSTLLMQAQLLKSGALGGDDMRAAAEAIERSTKLQVQLIEDLLDVSRIVTGKLALEMRPVRLVDAVTSTIDTVKPLADRKSVELSNEVKDGALFVSADLFRLQQAVWHLLTNAIKFTPSGGRVVISIAASDGRAIVRVRDTGIGIEPDFLPYVFNRFSQASPSRARSETGLGLGLAIARHIVEMHGGALRAESDGKGAGTTMTITLPLLASAAAKPAAQREKSYEN